MSNNSPLVVWCRRLLEFAWLLTIILIPSYFNLLSSRHFEPDKAVVLRAIVTMMIAFATVVWIHTSGAQSISSSQQHWWVRFRTFPLAIAIVAYVVIFLFATLTSIVPGVSWWGSYQRMQGTYTNLSYVTFAVLLIQFLRSREQLMRVVAAITVSALIPAAYGIVQHLELDPLPWKGDVITRVASTMGNSIFIAAYLILVVPVAIAFVVISIRNARNTPALSLTTGWQWVLGYACAISGGVVLVFAAMQFGGVVRAIDTRFWWVYPGSIIVAFLAFMLPVWSVHKTTTPRWLLIAPAIITALFAIVVLLSSGSGDGIQFITPAPDRFGAHWNLWVTAAVLLQFVAACFFWLAPQQLTHTPLISWVNVGAGSALTLLMLVTIFFTQSRGPWIGGAIGIFVFVTLLLVDIIQHSPHYARRAKQLIIAEFSLFLIITIFICVFNFANIPAFESLKKLPYIGRMGKLFDVSAGTTGDVRMKIWFGDAHAGGTIALITSNPVRTVIGWGPESMFVAYTPFYPPSLANVESRSASPDRSHQALLDELVNKGILGLVSYLAVIVSALGLAFRVRRNPATPTEFRVIIIAAISMVVAHNVEGLTGIPIVATLLFLWVAIALIVILNRFVTTAQVQPESTAPASAENNATTSTLPSNRRRKHTSPRTATPVARRATANDNFSLTALSVVVLLVGVFISWVWNLDNALADMRFQQGQNYSDSAAASGNTDQQIIGMSYYIDAIRMEPDQDIYYLNLGRSLLKFADSQRRQAQTNSQSEQTISLPLLLQQSTPVELQSFLLQRSPQELLQYAEATLRKAHDLNPYNKDHFANMARLYIFWYVRMEQNPEILQSALSWFKQGMAVAPQDVTIINEYIEALLTYADSLQTRNPTLAKSTIDEAAQMLARSKALDQKYSDTTLREANVLRAQGNYAAAVEIYVKLISKSPRALDAQITTIIQQLKGSPDLLIKIRDAYNSTVNNQDPLTISIIGLISSRLNDHDNAVKAFKRLAELQPDSLEAQQNYTIVLSDAQQYSEATIQAQKLESLAVAKGITNTSLMPYTQLINFLRAKATP